MPDFKYESLTNTGQARSGVLSAPDRAEVVRELLTRGETAVRIIAADDKSAGDVQKKAGGRVSAPPRERSRKSGRPTLNRSDMANLIRELATAQEAGLPLMQALRTVRRQARGKAMPVILDHLIERVEAGDALHHAAADYGPPFNRMIVGMLRAADASGEMSKVLHQLADLLERQLELRREVTGATIYPAIVASLIVVSVIVLVTVLVPRLIAPMAGEIDLPWPTKVLLNMAAFVGAYWLHCLIGLTILVIGARVWLNSPANQLTIDRFTLRLPLVGRLLRDVAVARFTRTLATLTSAGLPLLEALRITKNTLGNLALTSAIDEVQEQVTAGKSLAEPLERCGLFPPLLIQVVSLGERSGRLESMLMHAASAFDRRVQMSIKVFTKALPPFLLVIMASVGGFVLAAILLPLLDLQAMVK